MLPMVMTTGPIKSDDDWSYLGETWVDMSNDRSDEKTRMSNVYSSTHEESDHGSDDSGAGEGGSCPATSVSIAGSFADNTASVADPGPAGHGRVADSSASSKTAD
ncbi:hypothetical protein Bca4012_037835 [Brassica carinata]